jgi:hypothetical protein
MLLPIPTTSSSSATYGLIANKLPAVCGAGADTCIRTAQRRETLGGGRESSSPPNYRGCRHAKGQLQKRRSQKAPKTTTGRVFSSNLPTPGASFAAALRGSTQQQQRSQALQVSVSSPPAAKKQCPVSWTAATKRSVISDYKCKRFVAEQNVGSSNDGSTAHYDKV